MKQSSLTSFFTRSHRDSHAKTERVTQALVAVDNPGSCSQPDDDCLAKRPRIISSLPTYDIGNFVGLGASQISEEDVIGILDEKWLPLDSEMPFCERKQGKAYLNREHFEKAPFLRYF